MNRANSFEKVKQVQNQSYEFKYKLPNQGNDANNANLSIPYPNANNYNNYRD